MCVYVCALHMNLLINCYFYSCFVFSNISVLLMFLSMFWLFCWFFSLVASHLNGLFFFFSSLGSNLFVGISCVLIVLQAVKNEVAVPAEVPEGHPWSLSSVIFQSQSQGAFDLPIRFLQKDAVHFPRDQVSLRDQLSLGPIIFWFSPLSFNTQRKNFHISSLSSQTGPHPNRAPSLFYFHIIFNQ